jgi:hypothetical protein
MRAAKSYFDSCLLGRGMRWWRVSQKRDRKGRYVRNIEECIRHNGVSVVDDASAQGRGPRLEGET